MKRRYLLSAACLTLLLPFALALRPDAGTEFNFSAEHYMSHVKFLADDARGGRAPGSTGIEQAAEYIAEQFKKAGLQPVGDDGTYFQSFDVGRGARIVEEKAALSFEGLERTLTLKTDWIPMPFSSGKEASGPLAFCGYGISAEQYHYDDFADFEAEGKVIMIFRHEPKSSNEDDRFGGKNPSTHAMFINKARKARDNGAAALLIINPPSRSPDQDELYEFGDGFDRDYGIPIAHIKREVADALLQKANMPSLAALNEVIDKTRRPVSFDLPGLTAKLAPGVEPTTIKTRNVLGLLKGGGDTDEVIVIGSHYDHIGTQKKSDGTESINNGADDNASGTSGMLELVRAFSSTRAPRRGIVFMAFSAEEMGLIGSRYWVDHPTIELKRVKAMINLDMIGRYRPDKFEIEGTDTSEVFHEIVTRHADELQMKWRASRDMFGRSDHASFDRKQIPVIFAFTGLHPEYHKPTDDWDLINGEGATQVLQLMYRIARDVADLKEGPVYAKVDEKKQTRPAAEAKDAEKKPGEKNDQARPADNAGDGDGETGRPQMPRVRLGIMPNYTDTSRPGLAVEDTMPESPAAKAGIKANDRIVRINDSEVTNIETYMMAMSKLKPGEEVTIVVERGDQKLTLKARAAEPPPKKDGQ